MNKGYRIDEQTNEAICLNCGARVGINGKLNLNFCHKCGVPLNLKSAVKNEETINKEILKTLYQLLEDIKGKNAEDIIKQYIEEFK